MLHLLGSTVTEFGCINKQDITQFILEDMLGYLIPKITSDPAEQNGEKIRQQISKYPMSNHNIKWLHILGL